MVRGLKHDDEGWGVFMQVLCEIPPIRSRRIRKCGMQALKLLISRGAALDAQDADGQTPMHYAALSEHQEVSLGIRSATHRHAAGIQLGIATGPQTQSHSQECLETTRDF